MLQKKVSRQITIAEMAPHVHTFKIGENKVNKITAWLVDWIKRSLKSGKIKPYDFLPTKDGLAFHIGVSKGTMQSVFRALEDCGLVESKQKIGTYIKDPEIVIKQEKLTSKRDVVCEYVKKYIISNNLSVGENIASTRELAKILNTSNTTLRHAINFLASIGVLAKKNNKFVVVNNNPEYSDIETKTLTEKICLKLKSYIKAEMNNAGRLPSNPELAKMYGVSLKTIHDAIKILIQEGVIVTRRGRYGSVVANSEQNNEPYFYEAIEGKIKTYIMKNCEIGSRLPSIRDFAQEYKVSTKTVKKALDNLSEDGYVRLSRGRYGGTFVVDIPTLGESYTWLAISQDYMPEANN